VFTLFVTLLALVAFSNHLFASPERGAIQGTVTDPQGAFIPGAQVLVKNVDTGIELNLTTNSAGFYLATELVPGKYLVRMKYTGFATLEISGVTVTAGTTTVTDGEMKVGDAAQSVQVTAEAPLVDQAPSNFTTSIETRYIQDLPIQGRDIQTLVQLIPGVIQSSGPSGSGFGFNSQFGGFPDPLHLVGSSISVNGGQAGANGWYLEGSLNATVGAEAVVVNPSPDAVSEFNLVSNGLAAEYGRTSGAVVNVVLKSGTNQPHGSVYGYNRNSFFSATNPFARRDENGNPFLQPRVNYNAPGATFGGPVYIPKVYDGRNRTFFFVSEDVSILHENVNRILTVPLPAERHGDFRGDPRFASVCDPAAGVVNCLYDPFTTTGPDENGYLHRQPFITPVIPADRINSLAKFYLDTIPNPNFVDPLQQGPDGCGITCNNYIGAVGSGLTTHNVSVKIDHRISAKHSLFVDWLYNPSLYENYRYPWNGPTAQLSTGVMGSQPYRTRNQLAILGLTSSITPTLVNEARVSFGRQALISLPNPDSVTGNSQVKKMVAGMNFDLFDPYQSVPTINFDGFQFGPLPYQASVSEGQQAYTVSDNLTKVIGKHTLKGGFSFRRNNLFNVSGGGYVIGFDSYATNDPVTTLGGSGLASFLLGWVGQGAPSTSVQFAPWQTNDDYSAFVQDEFRVRPNLTLSFGLRYDVFGWIRERHNGIAYINFDAPNPEIPAYNGRLDYVGTPNHPDRNLFPANKDSLGPRFGFAWSPRAKTVIRGSFGIVYSNSMSAVFGQGNGAMSSAGNWVPVYAPITDPYGRTPSFILGQPAPTLPLPDLGYNRANNVQNLGAWTATFLKPPKDPYVETWSFFVQHEFPGNLVVNAGYVGSHGMHLAGDEIRNINTVPVSIQQSLRNKINLEYPADKGLIPLYGCDQDAATGQALCSGWYSFLPYPQYPVIAAMMAPDGYNKYNAGQLRVEKRYSHGLNFIAAYTFSKNIVSAGLGALVANTPAPTTIGRGSGGGVGRLAVIPGAAGGGSGDFWTHTNAEDTDNRRRYDALSPDDTPHVLNLAISYELPFGKGKPFLSGGGFAEKVFGGWKLAQNWNFQSGVPMFFDTVNYNGIWSARPNLVGDLSAGRGSKTKAQRQAQWYNPSAFAPTWGNDPALLRALSTGLNPDGSAFDYDKLDSWWQFGNVGLRPPTGRVPGFWNVDASLSKEWKIKETRRLLFRYDLLNALNHQNLGVPNHTWCLPPNADGSTDLIHTFGCQFGKITDVQTDPRAMQFGLRFMF
jgi:hypothetical protein